MDQKLAPCNLTKLFLTGKEDRAQSSWIEFPELIAPLIINYKYAFQYLQLTILEGEPNNLQEIGNCFEEYKNILINYFLSMKTLFKENFFYIY